MKYVWILLIAAVLVLVWLLYDNHSLRTQVDKLENNTEVLISQNNSYRTKENKLISQISTLSLTNDEFARINDSIKKELKDADIKLKNVTRYYQLQLESSYKINTIVKDSLVYVIDTVYQVKAIDYDSYWYKIKGYLLEDTLEADISCRHNVDIAEELIYKGWWIFKRLKRIDTKVIVSNPSDTIVTFKSIEVTKNNRKSKID